MRDPAEREISVSDAMDEYDEKPPKLFLVTL